MLTPLALTHLLDSPEADDQGSREDIDMPTNLVNLDALIPRQDFEVSEEAEEWRKIDSIQIRDLELTTFFYDALRKPDFQRETASWTPKKISDFIKTFLDGDLIPAIILWKSGKSIFVIDGAHRLSALIAWVQDDYGDKQTSRDFFENLIPREQQRAATLTRTIIQRSVGTYLEHTTAIRHPDNAKPETLTRAKRLASLAIQLQWVTGDAKKAEASFFKINQEATPIDKTELRILKSRNAANALAARAIIRSGTGHKYWSKFADPAKQEIERVAGEVYRTLFEPPLDTPIKTLDIPVAGRGYSAQALPLTFDLVNLSNDVKVQDFTKVKGEPRRDDAHDDDGSATIRYLKNTRRVVSRISGTHPSSLGLHPALYFYSSVGRYQPTSFLAVVSLVKYLETHQLFDEFISARRAFEDFLAAHRGLPIDVANKWGSGPKGFERLKRAYLSIFTSLRAGRAQEREIFEDIRKDEQLRRLSLDVGDEAEADRPRRDFDTQVKSAVFLREALINPLRCKICGGLIHYNSISVDHVVRRADGGLGVRDNGQLAHPYCNTTYKN